MAFWRDKALTDLTTDEWEALCDGCGKCCLHKLEDVDTGDVVYTNVACRMLDHDRVSCKKYAERKRFVPDCVVLTPADIDQLPWMPPSCAYRLLSEGKPLPPWHHLLSGSRETIHQVGQSVRGRIIDERLAGDLEDHVCEWPVAACETVGEP
ncbi:MAG: YcgN family cysteine cluster protein [Pseudomonadota bacterium]